MGEGTEKSLKEIADELGVDKQRVYRFVKKNHITASSEVKQMKQYNEVAQMVIKSAFEKKSASSETHQRYGDHFTFDVLMKELDIKNSQLEAKDKQLLMQQQSIEELTAALQNTTESLKASQVLHAGALQKQIKCTESDQEEMEKEPRKEKKWFKFWT